MRSEFSVAAATGAAAIAVIAGVQLISHRPHEFDAARSSDLQASADEVFRSFNGSKYERDAGAVIASHGESGPAVACMRARGLTSADWSLPRPVNPTSRGLESSVLFHSPDALPYTEMLMDTAPSRWPEAKQPGLSQEQAAIADECWREAPSASGEEASASPTTAKRLRTAWWSMLDGFDDDLGSQNDYWQCLSEKDIEGATGIDSTSAMLDALEDRTPAGKAIPDSADSRAARSPSWQRLVSFERALRRAEFSCRRNTYSASTDEVHEAIEKFARDHAEQIDEARSGWTDRVRRAEKLGFTGAYESLVDEKP